MKAQHRIVLLLLIIVGGQAVCWNNEPDIRIGNINPITVLTSSSITVVSVTAAYSTSLSSLTNYKSGLGLIGYESYLTNTFSFNTTVDNVGLTSISITVQPKDNTYLVNIKLRYIVSLKTPPNMDLLMACFKCMNISRGYGSRYQTFNSQNSMAMVNTTTLSVRSYLYAFNYTNLVGTINYLSVSSYNNGSKYVHKITTSDNTTVDFVCLTTLVWQTSYDTPGIGTASIFQTYSLVPASTTGIKYYLAFDCNDLAFFGLSMISHTMGGERLFAIYPQTYSSINTAFDYNNYLVGATLEVVYIGNLDCANSYQVYDPLTLSCLSSCSLTASLTANMSYICLPCLSICLTCNSTNSSMCLTCGANRNGSSCSCVAGFYQNSDSVCVTCNSSIPYCNICNSSSYCTSCSSPSPNNINGSCYCSSSTSTYIVNNVCLTFPGCTTAYTATNANYCQICDSSKNFQLDSAVNLTCRCKAGFNNSVNPNICSTICGNGIVSGKACDDNNTVAGDGCTNCTLDSGYYCYVAANTAGPSICILVGSSSISYLYAQHIPGTNQAKIYFQLYPLGLGIPSNTFAGHISSNASYSSLNALYDQSSSKITATIIFTQSMEGNNYYFTFDFSGSTVFYASPATVNLVTTGINQPLLLLNFNILIKTIDYVLIGLAVLAILITLVCSVAGYKLMGLQLILPLQAAYFTQLCLQNPPPYVSELKKLSFANGFNSLFSYNFSNYYLQNPKLPKFLFSVEYGVNVNVMIGVLLVCTSILVILQIIYLCHNNKAKKNQQEQEQIKVSKKNPKQKIQNAPSQLKAEDLQIQTNLKTARDRRNTYLNYFYFTIAMVLVQQCIFSFLVGNSQLKINAQITGADINLLLSYISIILIIPNLIYILDQYKQKKQKRALTFLQSGRYQYPLLFLYSYAIIAIVLGLTFTYSFALYVALVISVLPLIILLVMRPYRKNPFVICIISAVADQIMLVGAVIVYLINSIMVLSQLGWVISVLIIVCLIFISQTLTVIRMVKVIPWKELELIQRCLKKDTNKDKKKSEREDLLDRKPEVQMAEQIKSNLISGNNKMIDWQQRNAKEYQSIKSGKRDKQGQEQNQNSQENEEDELLLLKRRLKKQITTKRSKI